MTANLWYELREYLTITYRVEAREGEVVNVDEKFDLMVTVRNTAPAGYGPWPKIYFDNPQIYIGERVVGGRVYASPVNGPGPYDLPDTVLAPSESSTRRIPMKALRAFPELPSGWPAITEEIAGIQVVARLSQDRFFLINNSRNAYHDILPAQ
ncbi:hypothetical protein ACWEN6_24065 [Sphaerisporangium sp. NPDC004334]